MTSRFPQSLSSAILVVAATLVIISPLRAVDVFQQNARLGRGVNLLGWDPVYLSSADGTIMGTRLSPRSQGTYIGELRARILSPQRL
jgi:hypothetical protein